MIGPGIAGSARPFTGVDSCAAVSARSAFAASGPVR
jgi:hypothetical protein